MRRLPVIALFLLLSSCSALEALLGAAPTGGLPDLSVLSATNGYRPPCVAPGSVLSIEAVLINTGGSAAPAFDVLLQDTRVSVPDGLDPGETVTVRTAQSRTQQNLTVEIDPDNRIAEADETNNSATGLLMTLTQGPPCTPTP